MQLATTRRSLLQLFLASPPSLLQVLVAADRAPANGLMLPHSILLHLQSSLHGCMFVRHSHLRNLSHGLLRQSGAGITGFFQHAALTERFSYRTGATSEVCRSCGFSRAQPYATSSGRHGREAYGSKNRGNLLQMNQGRLKRISPKKRNAGAISSAKHQKKGKKESTINPGGPSKRVTISSGRKKVNLGRRQGKREAIEVRSEAPGSTAGKHQNKQERFTRANSGGPSKHVRISSGRMNQNWQRSAYSNSVSKRQVLKSPGRQQQRGERLDVRAEEQVSSPGASRSRLQDKRKRRLNSDSIDPSSESEAIFAKTHKKGKRVMRLDPHDVTSKRFQEYNHSESEEVSEKECKQDSNVSKDAQVLDKESKDEPPVSKNAQFRAIQPSPELLLHIERHLLGRRRLSQWQKAGYNVKLGAPLDNTPHTGKDEREPVQEEIFKHKLRFAAAANVASSFLPADLPEVAFAGTSNVGKSSLINALTRQWGVARTSDKPGLTQTINFFRLGGRLCLVDLPGYGFAYAEDEKKEAWEELVKEYVTSRESLRRVCLLVDAKWGLKHRDKELIAVMESAGTRYQVVLTKTDMFFPIDLARRVTEIQGFLKKNKSLIEPLMMVSSKTGGGVGLLRASLAKIAKASMV